MFVPGKAASDLSKFLPTAPKTHTTFRGTCKSQSWFYTRTDYLQEMLNLCHWRVLWWVFTGKNLDRVNSILRQLNTLNKLYRFPSHLQLICDFCPFPLICFQHVNLRIHKYTYKSEYIISLVINVCIKVKI